MGETGRRGAEAQGGTAGGAADAAAALRRAELLDRMLDAMRQEETAPRMMGAVLEPLAQALGAEGAAVLDLASPPDRPPPLPWPVLHKTGDEPWPVMADALAALEGAENTVALKRTAQGYAVLACPVSTRFGDRAGLVAWHAEAGRQWNGCDPALATTAAGLVRIVLEHEAIQREMARQVRTDPLTGLLTRRAFTEDAARRIDRLDREELPGTLLLADLDQLARVNERLGLAAGDEALGLAAELLRRTVRPTDLIARLNGDEFAVWLDGSDEMTAAERAEGLRTGFPQAAAHLAAGGDAGLTVSIGIACRRPGGGETLESLMGRAGQALHEVRRAGRGHWRVSRAEPMV